MGPGWYLIDEQEKKEVLSVFESNEFSRYRFTDEIDGKNCSKVQQFEQAFSAYNSSKYVIGMNSCTSAIYTAILALGLKPGDEIIVPGYTFIASIAPILFAGCIPILTEIDESLTIDPNDIECKISIKTKAIIAVHMLGVPCDMDNIMKIATKYKLHVIEDVAQANGASFQNKKLGSIGDFGTFSLNGFKIITAVLS